MDSRTATMLVISLYWLLALHSFAMAAELPSDSNGRIQFETLNPNDRLDSLQPEYEPEFGLFDRGIIGRQTGSANPIEKNTPVGFTIRAGESRCYAISREDLQSRNNDNDDDESQRRNELRDLEQGADGNLSERRRARRQTISEVKVSATTCLQPDLTNPDADNKEPPQLRLLAAKPGATQCPEWMPEGERPGESDPNYYEEHRFHEGLVFESLPVPEDGSVYVTIYAPEMSDDFNGDYDFELVMSTGEWYHRYVYDDEGSKQLLWMDSDSSAALLLTHNLTGSQAETDKILERDPPFELFVENRRWPVFNGIRRSLCGIEKKALISANKDGNGRNHELVRTSMTTRGGGDLPKQQFYFEGLNSSSEYNAILVQVADASEYDFFIDGDQQKKKRQEDASRRQMTVFEPTEFQTLLQGTGFQSQ